MLARLSCVLVMFAPCMLVCCSGASEPPHGLHSSQWAHHHRFLQSERAKRAAKANGLRFKQIQLLRHAQGIHNEAEERVGTQQWDAEESLKPEYLDPQLTAKGQEQCADFASRLPQAIDDGLSPQIVIVSPFLRTLQTAEHCLHALPESTAPWVVVEHARETIGEHTCDMRRIITPEIEAQHPRVQFHLLEEREDVQWRADHREEDEELLLRAARLVDFIYSLPEERILIVCHAGVINILSRLLGRPLSDPNLIDSPHASTCNAAAAAAHSAHSAQSHSHEPTEPSHTIDDVHRMFREDRTLEVEGIKSANCQLLSFCVARLPAGAHKLSKL